jgi:hypothetical protein
LDVTPLNPQEERTDLCVVGLWTQISVWIYRLPTLDVLHKEPLASGRVQKKPKLKYFLISFFRYITEISGNDHI